MQQLPSSRDVVSSVYLVLALQGFWLPTKHYVGLDKAYEQRVVLLANYHRNYEPNDYLPVKRFIVISSY